jgi:glycosyltransferase involved in cell wall biosynthesis
MPLFNKEKEVSRALQSVLAQTVSDFELIVVNDGSTDNGPEVARTCEDPRIKVIDQKNAGVSAARNRGIREARSELIAFLDADDEWKPTFLDTILALESQFSACSVFATAYLSCDVKGRLLNPVVRGIPSPCWTGILPNYFAIAARSDPLLCSSAVAVTKEAIHAVGYFPVGVALGEDLLTWARLAVKFQIAYTTSPCAIFHRPEGVASRPGRFSVRTDAVGQELAHLIPHVPSETRVDLEKYIALWHKMQCVISLQLGDRGMARRELQFFIKYSEENVQWRLYSVLALLPSAFTRGLLKLSVAWRKLRQTQSDMKLEQAHGKRVLR